MDRAADTIAKILRADKRSIYKLEERLSVVTGKKNILEKIVEENANQITNRLLTLGVARDALAKEMYDALISKIESDDSVIFERIGGAVCDSREDCNKILEIALRVANPYKGLFLREETARNFLRREPPRKIMEFLGYSSVDSLLEKEDLLEIYSALRFLEGHDWLNEVFFKQYENLKPDDFEERPVVVKALDQKWNQAAEKFVVKKWHNISHLKELGVVFVIPLSLGISGELLRMLSLVLHYLREIPFYSEIFKKISEIPETFSENFVSLLRGDVLDRHLPESNKALFLITQRYLAKEDENDWRLFVPHINPEALHWVKAEEDLVKMGNTIKGVNSELSFWRDLDWVGGEFKDELGEDVLVSFNLVDAVMSLVKEKEMIKYLYHHQEALWNKIFIEYFNREELEKFSKEYLLQGYFEI